MKIPHKIMQSKENGDIMAIVRHSGISRPTITQALKSGTGSRRTVNAVISYYESVGVGG